MSSTATKDSTLDRIVKLIRLASSPNENEARTAAFLACKLMRENDIMPGASSAGSDEGEGIFWKSIAESYRNQLDALRRQQRATPPPAPTYRQTAPSGPAETVRIRSKFAGTCKACRVPFNEGTEVFWRKGAGSVCVQCRADGIDP